MPQNTQLPSHRPPRTPAAAPPTLASSHPGEGEKPRGRRAPSDGSFKEQPPPPPSQPPPHTAVKFTGRADRVTGQAAGTAGDGGLQDWGRHKGGAGREAPFPVGPHGNRMPEAAAVQEVGLPVKAKEEGARETPPAQRLPQQAEGAVVGTSPGTRVPHLSLHSWGADRG